jgi:hypothetical protein
MSWISPRRSLRAVLLVAALPLPSGAEEVPVRAGQPFPALALPALADGSPLSIEQFRGRKVLLHQFASW